MNDYLDDEGFICPASFAQQRLWFLHQWEPDSSFYTVARALALSGPLWRVALENALNEIVQRHEVLRTTFKVRDGQPMQCIAPHLRLSLPVLDLTRLSTEEQPREVQRLLMETILRPFDLSRGPLFRALLLGLGETEHVLHLALHHIVADGWSLSILFRELALCYARQLRAIEAYPDERAAAQAARHAPRLSELPIQYADFAAWQHAYLQGAVLEQLLNYWKRQLAGAPPVLTLPTDHPRPAELSFRGSHYRFELAAELSRRLNQLSRQAGVTLFMLLLAAFQVLLARYSGQEDIVVGSPIANRTRAEVEGLIGFFVNTLVLRCNLSGNPSFRELLKRVREVCLDAYARQDLPFERLVEELQPERDPNINPLFQVMFSLQNTPLSEPALEGLRVRLLPLINNTSKVDLSIDMEEWEQGLRGQVEYLTDLFEEATIARLVEYWRMLLEGIAADPDLPISRLPLLSSAECRQLLVEWNATSVPFPERSVIELFEEQAACRPEVPAVFCGDTTLTYSQLNQRANQLAHYLRGRGVSPGTLVGLALPRSVELVVAMLGTLKAGAAYLPLDPTSPAGRLTDIFEDARPTLLLTLESLRAHLPANLVAMLCLDEIEWEVTETPDNPPGDPHPQQPAYVIFTSGSTGRPRGVCVPNAALWNHCQAVRSRYQLREGDRVLQFASPGFDVAAEEIFPTLASGAALVIWSGQEAIDLVDFARFLCEQGVSVLNLPASFWHAWVDEMAHNEDSLPASLRLVITGSEPVFQERLATWQRLAGERVAWCNAYGVTEATITSTLYVPELVHDIRPGATVPIGRPLANIQVYVLDDELQPLPIGVPGEIYIGGPGLATGYLHQPDLTAERFVPHPFSGKPGARLYRTGDLVRYRAEGVLEYRGRRDRQVKIRGYRIEPGEIECILARHPAVREVAVRAWEGAAGESFLAAYLVPAAGTALAEAEVRRFLQLYLPEYMRPAVLLIQEELPHTPGGKIDYPSLPRPAAPAANRTPVSLRTPLEALIANIWSGVLAREPIGVSENFFELGGHSLRATQVISRLRAALRIEIPVRLLFEAPTVALLAERIERLLRNAQGYTLPPLQRVNRAESLPLSFGQQRLWFLNRLEPGNAAYNSPCALRLQGLLNLEALKWSVNELLCRHEALRTSFTTDAQDTPVQVIASALSLPLETTDMEALPEAERELDALRHCVQEARRPFDLERGPLIRVHLIRLSPEEHILQVTMHHIISDGWSQDLYLGELASLYEVATTGTSSSLASLPFHYADYAAWQRQVLQGEVLEALVAYWKTYLMGAPTLLELPTDRPRPAVQSYQGARHLFSFESDLVARLRRLALREESTLFMLLLAAFQVLLFSYSEQDEFLLGTPIANRSLTATESIVGFFANTLVLRARLADNPDFLSLLRRVREDTLGASAHQDLPFEKLVEILQPRRDPSRNPLFQVMFVFHHNLQLTYRLSHLTMSLLHIDHGVEQFDLSLSVAETEEGLQGMLRYNTRLFEAETIERMARHLQAVLAAAVEYPEWSVANLLPLSEAERQALRLQRARQQEQQGEIAEMEALAVVSSTLEQLIGQIWQEVLGVERVSPTDNFFDLGGHSMLLLQVHNRLSAHLQQPLTVVNLFQYPTIRTLASYISAQQQIGARRGVEPTLQIGQSRAKARLEAMQRQLKGRQRPGSRV